jgi:hypothetical protein
MRRGLSGTSVRRPRGPTRLARPAPTGRGTGSGAVGRPGCQDRPAGAGPFRGGRVANPDAAFADRHQPPGPGLRPIGAARLPRGSWAHQPCRRWRAARARSAASAAAALPLASRRAPRWASPLAWWGRPGRLRPGKSPPVPPRELRSEPPRQRLVLAGASGRGPAIGILSGLASFQVNAGVEGLARPRRGRGQPAPRPLPGAG